ncbi:MAG: hypothetical protein ACRD1M_04780 [Terriglobales bacterium]
MRSDLENPLAGLGYTPREAAFLCMVAMHSGVFQRRHFVEFTGAGDGKAAQVLISKLLSRHGQAVAFGKNRFLYRLSHKAVYRALGIEDSNNRKGRSPALMKARLMALDLVLAHTDARFLETEDAKVRFFTVRLGMDSDALPRVDYPSRKGSSKPRRHWFVEKYPIFLTGTDPGLIVNFSFVDDGQATVSSFANFLRRYNSVFAAARFRLHYVTESTTAAATARRHFDRTLNFPQPQTPPPSTPELDRYFELMKGWQEGARGFSGDQFSEFFRLRRLYGGPRYAPQYDAWLRGETVSLAHRAPVGRDESGRKFDGKFEPMIVGGRYGFLSVAVPAPAHLQIRRSPRAAPADSPENEAPAMVETAQPEEHTAPAEPAERAAPKKPPGQNHAGNDPVMTGFDPTGQSFAVPHSRHR